MKEDSEEEKLNKNSDKEEEVSTKEDVETSSKSDKKEYKKASPKKKHKALRVILVILTVLLVIALAIVAAGYFYLNSKIGEMNYDANFTKDENELGISKGSTTSGVPSNYRNIALFGIDSYSDDLSTDYRTDSIIILSINEDNNECNLFSIYRDTYVRMENTMKDNKRMDKAEVIYDKINHAYYDGVTNSVKTINTNLDLNIKDYVIGNFSTVVDAVDKVGGIDIDLTSDEINFINGYIKSVGKITDNKKETITITTPGVKHLNGVQAMAYCRIRYTKGGDYKRTERMRTVLSKVIEKVKGESLTEINDFLNTILPEIQTSLSSNEIFSLIPVGLKMNFNKSFGWPYETTGVWMKNYNTYNFYGPANTLESNVKKLHQELFEQENYEVPQDIIDISNEIIKRTGVGK